MKTLVSAFLKDESGATAIEYAIMASGIALVIIAAVGLVGDNLDTAFTAVATGLD